MKSYLIRRILVMIPTFFGVSLIVFGVVNLAPGRPGAARQGTDLAADIRGEKTQESYRIFREQFNLDKPVLFNTLFALDRETVRNALRAVAGGAEASPAQRIRAQEQLEDFGRFAVPHLIAIVAEADAAGEQRLRDVAVYFLRLNGRQRLVDPFATHPTPEAREVNRRIDAENARIRALRYALEDPEAKKREVIEGWQQWHQEKRQRWEWSRADRLRIFFLDTRHRCFPSC